MRRLSWLLSLVVLVGGLLLGGAGAGRALGQAPGTAVRPFVGSCPTTAQCAPAPRPRPAEPGGVAVGLAVRPIGAVEAASWSLRSRHRATRLARGVTVRLLRPPQAAQVA